MVALVALHAFEALAVAAAMPTVAEALDGLRLYALAFGGTLATSVIGMTLAGRWADRQARHGRCGTAWPASCWACCWPASPCAWACWWPGA